MPLIKSRSESAFKTNVAEMIRAKHPRDQALAAAYRIKREGRAIGGQTPWQVRSEARSMTHAGPIMSAVAGRTDHHPMNVAAGSYVLPADHVSSLGQGNTQSGMAVLGRMFRSSPYGAGAPLGIKHGAGAPHAPKAPGMKAKGGASDSGGSRGESVGHPVPIAAAGGEYVIPPHEILSWLERQGLPRDLKFGHAMLDDWVKANRKKHIKTLSKLPGPAKG